MRETAVERLVAQEVAAVAALARCVWQATYPALISQAQIDFMLAERYAPERIRRDLSDPAQAWWTAHRDGALAGFAHARLEAGTSKLDKLYVDPAQQRRGVGAALVAEVAAWARAAGAAHLRLQVNRGNAQAIRAHEKYGFRIVAAQAFDIGHGYVMDDYVMERVL